MLVKMGSDLDDCRSCMRLSTITDTIVKCYKKDDLDIFTLKYFVRISVFLQITKKLNDTLIWMCL